MKYEHRPNTSGQGLINGTKSLYKSILSGMKGTVYLPYQGAKEEGTVGLIKGTAKGVAGLVLKPISGVIDIFSITCEGIHNDMSIYNIKKRQRTKRVLYGRFNLIKSSLCEDNSFKNSRND